HLAVRPTRGARLRLRSEVFQGLTAAWRLGEALYAEIELPEQAHADAGRFGLHPALLDVVHALGFGGLGADEDAGQALLPFSWAGVTLRRLRDRRAGQLAPVEEDLDWLVPSEWQWFAHWRQSLRDPLDETVLRHLSLAAVTRFARFDLRGLVLRDDRTNELAPEAGSHETRHDLGLRWLAHEAKEFPDSIEVALDALQYATEASWFTLRVLTSIDDEHSEEVRAQLREFATQRQLGEEILHRWGM
ncbi:polyketide synthase dehydratase domain-containing protein, partial [Streptomyces cirratus]|uniref:polyketide synthase dehydratase domain-containing protein n=1 Tax=Streptomyces cirratus TaxID=68187 RepID=UPI00361ACB33